MNPLKVISGILAAVLLLLLMTALFTVTQGQEGIVLRLGRLVNESGTDKTLVLKPGLHFRIPFIESVRLFDTRLQTFDIKSSRIVTREKKDVMVDYFVKWRIQDLARYYKSTGGFAAKAETLLEQQLNTALRAEFGKRTISDVVTGGRDDVMDVLRARAQQQARDLGIAVTDVRIKGIELPENTSNAIYQRMRADMRKIANRHRADGSAAAEAIQASADAEVTVILAKARSEGQKARAAGQAQAAALYLAAYGKDPDFFAFYRSLKAYEQSFSGNRDVMVLDMNSTFFQYFRQGPSLSKLK